MSTGRWADALAGGDLDALAATMHRDVVLVSDGGGRVVTPLRPVRGAASVARVVSTAVGDAPGRALTVEQVNGRPAVVVRRSGRACAVVVAEVDGALVVRVWLVLNPDKLVRWHAPR
ncbi:nuclear transport factor 2 family protein [Terrabacter sp. LjRoot27]|uniref:nuclear transport factor 2 family protein n=1 Tax=Terrabacter sp. LjRoot27 TaxID=3342306 RepID=UPI003ECC602D